MALFGSATFGYYAAISSRQETSSSIGGLEMSGGYISNEGFEVEYSLSAGPGYITPMEVSAGGPLMQVSVSGQSTSMDGTVRAEVIANYSAQSAPDPPGATSIGTVQNVTLIVSGYVADGDIVDVRLSGTGLALGSQNDPDTKSVGTFTGGPFTLSHVRTKRSGAIEAQGMYEISIDIGRSAGSLGTTSVGISSGGLYEITQLAGDFDLDGDIDGRDFLAWQRNPSVGDLADWQTNYGVGTLTAISMSVPEPTTCVSCVLAASIMTIFARISVAGRNRCR